MNAKKLLTMSTLATAIIVPSLTQATGPMRIFEVLDGTNTLELACAFQGGCTGDLVQCPAGSGMNVSKMTYSLLEGVCDDAGDRACRGRLTVLQEGCFDLRRDIKRNGTITTETLRGGFRVCFDETGASDCTGSPPSAMVIAKADSLCQVREIDVPEGTSPPVQITCDGQITDKKRFTIDGAKVRYPARSLTFHATGQAEVNRDKCVGENGTPGCGVSGVSVATGHH